METSPMFQHNMRIAFRNILRHKGSFSINLIGLSTGLACALLIYLWVTDELKFDKFHAHDTRLYQVLERSTENGDVIIHENTQGPLAEAMKKELPEVAAAVSVMSLEKNAMKISIRVQDEVVKSSGIFAGKDFLGMFTFPLMYGNAKEVLQTKEAIVLSHPLALSLFGSADKAIGKKVSWEVFGRKQISSVTGVFAPLPQNNSMKFDFVANWDVLYQDLFADNFQRWSNTGPDTYLMLKEGTNVAAFDKKIARFIDKYEAGNEFALFVRPYSSAYLYGRYENGIQSGGRIEYVKLFSIVGIFILLIACINFMNLSTAEASRRLKEVGIKKAIGSSRRSLIIQFLTEAVLMALFSMIAAVILVMLVMPAVNQVSGKQLSIPIEPNLISLILLATIGTGLFAGSYPAFYMSGMKVITLFKGTLRKSVSELLTRKGLVIFQFMLSFVLIVGVIVIVQQVNYVRDKNIGYDKANVIQFDKEGTLNENANSFLSELKKVPGVLKASTVQQNVIQQGNGASTYGISWPGKSPETMIDIAVRAVNYDLLETLGIDITEGRSFSEKFGSDNKGLIFNETAIKIMGLKNPVGTNVNMWGEEKTIVGVVKDFHITSLHEPISPLVFYFDPARTSTFMVKIVPGKERHTIAQIEALHKKFNAGFSFQYSFLDEQYQAQYVSEQRVSMIAKYFAGLAIIISCLGLFGLAAFNAAIRKKEIGIRKVLGASVNHLMLMLSKDFLVLVLVSMVIGFPLAWLAMNAWLKGFAYRIDIGPGVFIIAGASVTILALITVSYQSLKTAVMNPVKSLRTE